MAYVFMRNVRHVLQPISSLSSVSLQQQVKGVQSLKKILSLQYQQSFPRANFSASTFLQNSSPAAVTSENDASITKQGQQNNGVAHNNQTHKEQHTKNTVKLNTAKTKEAHRKRFHNAIEKGEVLTSEQAFHYIKSCGPQMVGEDRTTRNQLVNEIWNAIQENGVALEIPLWNTLLSVYIDNRCVDFEPIDFLSKLWETSASEPNLTTFNLLIRAYAMKADPVGSMKIVDYMVKNNTRMSEQTYSWLIQSFARKGDTKAVDEILSTMKDIGIKPKQITYGRLIDAYAENGDIESIDKTINEMTENKVYPSSQTYFYMLESLAHGGHKDLLESVWERIQNVESLVEDVKPLILTCVCNGSYDFAFELIQLTTSQTSSSKNNYHYFIERKLFNLLYYCRKDLPEYIKALSTTESSFGQRPLSRVKFLTEFFVGKNDYERAIGIIKVIDPSKVKTPLFHPILQGVAKQNNIQGIVEILQEMTHMNIEPDFYCTNIISPALGEPGTEQHNTFVSLLKDKTDVSLPYNTLGGLLQSEDCGIKELTSLIRNASKGDVFGSLVLIKKKIIGDFNASDACQVLQALNEKGMKDITILSYEIVRSLDTDAGVVEGMNFVKELMEMDIPVSSETYTSVLRSLRRHRLSDEFFMFVRVMKEHGVEPDIHQYYQMLNMAAMVGNSMAAQFCFNKVAEADEFTKMRPRLYNWLIKAYGKDSEANKVLPNYLRGNFSESAQKTINLFQEMKEANYEPNPFTVSTIIRSHLQNGDFEGAQKLIDEYGESELKMNNMIQTDFIRSYITHKRFGEAEKLFESLKAESKVTLPQFNEMLRMYELQGDVAKSEQLYQEMLGQNFWPNAPTYAVRIRTYLTAKQPEKCIEIIEDNITQKNDLRVELYMVVLRHLVPTGNVECVQKMIDLIKEHHSSKVPPHRLNEALILSNIKAGNIQQASALLPKLEDLPTSSEEHNTEPALNPYRKAAKSAHLDGDVEYIENLIEFLKVNNLYYQTLDTFYLLALNKMDNVDSIKKLYDERIAVGFQPTEKFMSLLHQIIEVRNLEDFTVQPTDIVE